MFRICRKVVLHRLFQFWQIMLAYVLTFEITIKTPICMRDHLLNYFVRVGILISGS